LQLELVVLGITASGFGSLLRMLWRAQG